MIRLETENKKLKDGLAMMTKQRDAQRLLVKAGLRQQGLMRERIDGLENEAYAALALMPDDDCGDACKITYPTEEVPNVE